ncbi:MAG: cation transporting ATPase C-terminal domain-containing protein, partial [Candidatus Fonsibacter sp.]
LHIAFLELVIDPACSLAFEAEEGSPDLMAHPPRSPHERLLSTQQVLESLTYGGLTTLMVFLFYGWLLSIESADVANAAAFVMLVTANAVLLLPARAALHRWTLSSLTLT